MNQKSLDRGLRCSMVLRRWSGSVERIRLLEAFMPDRRPGKVVSVRKKHRAECILALTTYVGTKDSSRRPV